MFCNKVIFHVSHILSSLIFLCVVWKDHYVNSYGAAASFTVGCQLLSERVSVFVFYTEKRTLLFYI